VAKARSVKVNPPAADKNVKLKTAEEECFIKMACGVYVSLYLARCWKKIKN